MKAQLHAGGLKRESIRKTLDVREGLRLRGQARAEPGTRPLDRRAPTRGPRGACAADREARRRRLSPPPHALPASAGRARRHRDARRRARDAHLGRRRRGARALARNRESIQDEPPVGYRFPRASSPACSSSSRETIALRSGASSMDRPQGHVCARDRGAAATPAPQPRRLGVDRWGDAPGRAAKRPTVGRECARRAAGRRRSRR